MSRIERVDPDALTPAARERLVDELYGVHSEVFDGVDRAQFRKYVVCSPAQATWIDVFRDDDDRAVGYLALHRFDLTHEGRSLAVFRAEAGMLRAYRGKTSIGSLLVTKILAYRLRYPTRAIFYFGSLVHPSSYHGIARFGVRMWPHPERRVPPAVESLMTRLGERFGLDAVDPARPLVRDVGWITRDTDQERAYWERCSKPTARFFVEANPGYGLGHGLLTLVPLTLSNLGLGALRWLWMQICRRAVIARARLQHVPGLQLRTEDRHLLSAAPDRSSPAG